jgi:hypothetical protein
VSPLCPALCTPIVSAVTHLAAGSDSLAIIALVVAGISAAAGILGVIVGFRANRQSRKALEWQQDRDRERSAIRVEVRVHQAILLTDPRQPSCYFVNIHNASPEREVTVTHVWFATAPEVHVGTKPLPKRIAPGDQWETWVEASALPAGAEDVETLARAKLADGTVISSTPREDVPAAGYVPG